MMTKDLARLMRRVGSVLAVAIAVVGGVVPVIAAPPATKVQMCHVVGNGRSHMISVSGNAESAHRAHGDARPGEPVPGQATLQFDAACEQVPPPKPSTLACPCWNGYTEPQLLSVLGSATVAGETWCIANGNTVSLTTDLAITKLVYVSGFGSCILRRDGQDVASVFSMTPTEANQCMTEAAALVPLIASCPQ